MRFAKRLYMGESAAADAETLVRQIQQQELLLGIYVLVLPSNPQNQLDILMEAELLQPHYRTAEPVIVGIAGGREEAFGLVEQMAQEALLRYGAPDIRQLLADRERGDADA